MNPKRPTPRHIITKMPKVKDRENLKSSKRKEVTSLPIRLSANFSTESLQTTGIGTRYSK